MELIPYQPNDAYDQLLAGNLAFVHLHSAVASNTIVECMVRNTPILVNPLPPVVDYLGQDYPLYFRTLGEAARLAEDMGAVRAAHQYLVSLPKHQLSPERFRRSIAESDLYRGL